MKDAYRTLGIPPTATLDEAKQAYRRLARRYHPDVSTEPDAEARFKEISAAYEAIKNPPPQNSHTGAWYEQARSGSFDDFLRGFAGVGTVMRNTNVAVTLEQAYTGVDRTLPSGTEIHIPAGVRSGTQFATDAHSVITVHVQPHAHYERNQDDLLRRTQISLSQAVLGCTAELVHLDGRRYQVQIPAGIQPGQTVRLRGLGMQNPQWPQHRGDLFVQVSVQIPHADQLTESQKQAIIQTGYQSTHNV